MAGYPLFSQPSAADISTANTKSPHTISIASMTSHRLVVLDPFIESFNFKVSKKTEFKKFDAVSTQGGVIEEPSEISISITMNLPAADASSASRNMLKIQELQTMINPVIGKKNNTAIMLVHMKNLIAKLSSNSKSLTYNMCKKYGLPCHISSIDYTPDFEVGFFSEKLPKNIKLSLDLKIINQKLNLSQDGDDKEYDFRFAQSFIDNGMYSTIDRKGFPFGFYQFNDYERGLGTIGNQIGDISSYTPKKMSTLNSKSSTFIMFTNHIEETNTNQPHVGPEILKQYRQISDGFGDNIPDDSITPEDFALRQAGYENVKIARWVAFEPIINEINRTVEVEHVTKKVGNGAFSTGYESTVPKLIKFSLDFDVVANSIEESKINLAKLNTLFRLSSAPTKEKFIPTSLMVLPERKTGFAKTIKVLIPGFIQASNLPITKKTSISLSTRKALLPNCADLHVYSVDFDIDDDIGFFEDGGYLLPKAYKVKMELYSTSTGIQNTAAPVANATPFEVPEESTETTGGGGGTAAGGDGGTTGGGSGTVPANTSPTSPTYNITRVPGLGSDSEGNPDPNVHVFDLDGNGTPDAFGTVDPTKKTYTTFTSTSGGPNGGIDPIISAINSGQGPEGGGIPLATAPNEQVPGYTPESVTDNGVPSDDSTRITPNPAMTSPSDPNSEQPEDPGGTTGTGTETSETTGVGSTDDPTAGGGDGYFGYDPDFAY